MMRNPILLAVLLPLAACGQPAEQSQPTNSSAAAQPNPYHLRLKAMEEPLRRATLMRAIIDSGQVCKRVAQADYRGRYQNLEMWTARCEKGGEWGVFLGADSSVQIRACGELAQLGLPTCEGPMLQ